VRGGKRGTERKGGGQKKGRDKRKTSQGRFGAEKKLTDRVLLKSRRNRSVFNLLSGDRMGKGKRKMVGGPEAPGGTGKFIDLWGTLPVKRSFT